MTSLRLTRFLLAFTAAFSLSTSLDAEQRWDLTHQEFVLTIDPLDQIGCRSIPIRVAEGRFESRLLLDPTAGPITRAETIGEVTVNFSQNFPSDARTAFLRAIRLWQESVDMSVAFSIDAIWEDLPGGTLGRAGPLLARGSGTPVPDVWYATALLSQIVNAELFPNQADITVRMNSSRSDWYFGLDGNPASNQIDFVTIVMHELGHGFGFADSFEVDGSGTGSWGLGDPLAAVLFDTFVQDGTGAELTDTATFPNPSEALGDALVGDVRFDGAQATSANGGTTPPLFAPDPFLSGSSIAHWDESTFPAGTANALMTPSVALGEVNQSAGPLTDALMLDLGWEAGSTPPNSPPVADAGADQTVKEQSQVQLDGSASFDVDIDPLSFQWTQLSGPSVALTGATTATAQFTAPDIDTTAALEFQLEVSDGSDSDSDTVTVTVTANSPPVADAGPNQSGEEGSRVFLSASGSSDPDGDPITFFWTQLQGPSVNLSNRFSQRPEFTAPFVSGDTLLVFELSVSDGMDSDTDTVDITVLNVNQSPVADAGPDQTVGPGAEVSLTGSGSSDPDGDDLTFSWKQTSGPALNLEGATTASPSFTAPEPPQTTSLAFELEVSDGSLSDTDTVVVTVEVVNEPPEVDAGEDQTVLAGRIVTLVGTVSDPDGDELTFEWQQTAGPEVTLQSPESASTTWRSPETAVDIALTFRLTASDGRGGTASDEVTVVVLATEPLPETIFAQFLSGESGGRRNRAKIILRNNQATPTSGLVSFKDQQGNPLAVPVGGESVDRIEFTLPPWGSTEFETDGTGELVAGIAEVRLDENPVGGSQQESLLQAGKEGVLEASEVFEVLGSFVSVEGVSPRDRYQAYVSFNEDENTGLAIYNPNPDSLKLRLKLLDDRGEEKAALDLTLEPGHQLLAFVNEQELFDEFFSQVETFKGTLNVVSADGARFALLALIQKRSTGALVSVPTSSTVFAN